MNKLQIMKSLLKLIQLKTRSNGLIGTKTFVTFFNFFMATEKKTSFRRQKRHFVTCESARSGLDCILYLPPVSHTPTLSLSHAVTETHISAIGLRGPADWATVAPSLAQ